MALGNLYETFKHVDAAFVTLFGGLILGRLAGKLCSRLLKEAEIDRIAQGFSDALGAFVSYVSYFVTVLLVLQQFALTYVAFVLLGLIAVIVVVFTGVMIVADLTPNFILGFRIRPKLKRFAGKRVQIGKVQGELVSVGWIDCVVKDKEVFAVPYRYLRTHQVRPVK